jgi:hypothetical protein
LFLLKLEDEKGFIDSVVDFFGFGKTLTSEQSLQAIGLVEALKS